MLEKDGKEVFLSDKKKVSLFLDEGKTQPYLILKNIEGKSVYVQPGFEDDPPGKPDGRTALEKAYGARTLTWIQKKIRVYLRVIK